MADTIDSYNHTNYLIASKALDYTDLYVMLLNNSATFTAANTTVTSVDSAGTYEVYGNGWTQRGIQLTTVAWSQVALDSGTNNDTKLSADNVIVNASGGAIGPAYKALIHAKTLAKPLWFITFGSAQTAGSTTDFKITWAANGIHTLTKTG